MYPARHSPLGSSMNRRDFLGVSATIALGGALAACGRGSGAGPAISGASGDVQLVSRFPKDAFIPGRVRLPLSLADESGILGNDGKVTLPDTLTATVTDTSNGKVIASGIVASRHGSTLSVPYWPLEVNVDMPGIFTLTVEEAPGADAAFQVLERSRVAMPVEGDPLPPFDTPTIDDPRGVEPICTRPEGTCPFHSMTLTEALASGKPVAYLIGTPAYCTTGTCAPALEALMAVSRDRADSMVFVHADVYSDKSATTPAPAVRAYKLTYEPILYVTDARGTLVRRLDAVFDEDEIRASLA